MPTPNADPGCALCRLRGRRSFTALLGLGLALPLAAQPQVSSPGTSQKPQTDATAEGVKGDVGKTSTFARFVPADWLEQQSAAQYQQMMRSAAQQRQLAGEQDRQLVRLRFVAQRITPHASPWNKRAPQWKWEVNLLNQPVLNAFCMPGGKIAFYQGILAQLQLSDDEVATIMGHEVAHALREHARERLGKTVATRGGLSLAAEFFGLGGAARAALDIGAELAVLKFSRDDETEADLVGMELAARAGYNPAAGVTLWQKMMAASKGAPPQFLNTHPAGTTRIKDIQSKLAKVEPLFQRAARPDRSFGPPPA